MRIDIAAKTDVGRRKRKNEDSYGVFGEETQGLRLVSEGALLCVADGLGGHTGGEIASKLAVSVVRDVLKEAPPPPAEDTEEDMGPLSLIKQYITKANESIHTTNRDLIDNGKPMGTTLCAVLVAPRVAYVANVGDSRCYHIREGEVIARTEDHSWVDEQVKLGMMSKAEAEQDSRKNVVTRSIGTHPEVEVDTYKWYHVPGDQLLLCTDGLVNMVKDADIRKEFQKGGSADEIAGRLVDLANINGGKDNITVVVATVSPNPVRLAFMKVRRFFLNHRTNIIWAIITALAGAGGFAAGFLLRDQLAK